MGDVVRLIKHPEYCCNGWEGWGTEHKRCSCLCIDDALELRCKKGIPLDEDMWPPEVECNLRVDLDTCDSVYGEVIITFNSKEV